MLFYDHLISQPLGNQLLIITVPRPGKQPDLPESYRPISLITVLGNIFLKKSYSRDSPRLYAIKTTYLNSNLASVPNALYIPPTTQSSRPCRYSTGKKKIKILFWSFPRRSTGVRHRLARWLIIQTQKDFSSTVLGVFFLNRI